VPTYRPDLSIETASTTLGVGVVNATGVGQLVDLTLAVGSSATVRLELTNSGAAIDTFGLAEARSGAYAAFSRTWTRDAVDVTVDLSPDVGWHQVTDVPMGARRELQLRVEVPAAAVAGTTASYALHGYHSPASAGIKDVVVVRVTATAAPTASTPPPVGPTPVTTAPVATTPVDATPVRLDRVLYVGKLVVGRRLVARLDSDAGARLTYAWLRGGRVLRNATQRSYVLRARDRGQRITLRVTARATGHPTTTATYRRDARVR
jgi:hypothetical protein